MGVQIKMGDLLSISKDKKYACLWRYHRDYIEDFFADLKTLEKQRFKFWFSSEDMHVFKK